MKTSVPTMETAYGGLMRHAPIVVFGTIFCQQTNKQTKRRLEKFLIQSLGQEYIT